LFLKFREILYSVASMHYYCLVLCLLLALTACHAFQGGPPVELSPTEETTDLLFLFQCIDQHNEYRRRNNSEIMLNFNRDLTDLASRRATKMASTGKLLVKNPLQVLGIEENVAFITTRDPLVNCREMVDSWYTNAFSDVPKKVDDSGNVKIKTSVHREMVWKKSQDIGCSRVTASTSDGAVILCLYRNPASGLKWH